MEPLIPFRGKHDSLMIPKASMLMSRGYDFDDSIRQYEIDILFADELVFALYVVYIDACLLMVDGSDNTLLS